MQAFINWFNDPLIQSIVISPLVGAVLGILFAGLNNPPTSTSTVSVNQTVVVFKKTIVVNHSDGRSTSSDDALAYIFAALAIVVGVTWGYSRYAAEIHNYWMSGLFSCTAFIISAGIVSFLRDQFNSSEWGWYIFAPIIAVGFSFYLVHLSQTGVVTGAREAAQRHGFIEFYKILNDEQRIWLLFQIFGVICGVLGTLAATLRSVHYLALMNQRTNSGLASIWHFLARLSFFSAGVGGIVFLLIAVSVSYVLLSGIAFDLWRSRG